MTSDDPEVFEKVRRKDHAVLACIRRGDTDVHSINQTTTLSRREINYSFEKLDDLGLITVERPDGWTERVVDGQKRKFRTPKQASLTQDGVTYFDWTDTDGDLGRYDSVEFEDVVTRVQDLEEEVERLRQAFTQFRKQVLRELRDDSPDHSEE